MPRRRKTQATKRDWRWYAMTALNVFVALSMVLGTVLLFSGGSLTPQQRVALPTVVESSTGAFPVNTLAPTVGAPTSVAPPGTLPTLTPELSPTAKP